jgi:HlyD family secretion protein
MIQSQKVKIISKRLPFKHLVVGAVLLLGGGAYSLWRLHTPSTQPTKPLKTNKKVQIATALDYRELRSKIIRLSAPNSPDRKVAGLKNSQVTGGIDDIDIT